MKKFLKKQQAVEIFKDIFSTLFFSFWARSVSIKTNVWSSNIKVNYGQLPILSDQTVTKEAAPFTTQPKTGRTGGAILPCHSSLCALIPSLENPLVWRKATAELLDGSEQVLTLRAQNRDTEPITQLEITMDCSMHCGGLFGSYWCSF